MSFYLIVAIITSFLSYLTFKFYDTNRSIAYILLTLLILFPSSIEGLRNMNIGGDMLGYGQAYFFNAASYDSVFRFVKDLDTKEYGYHLLNYFCSRIGGINVMMFAAALIKMTMVALTCVRFRKQTIPWLVVFTYMLFFYWYGFSLMRQSIALSICLFSLTYLNEKRYIPFTICGIIAYFFHSSGIFCFAIPVVLYLSRTRKRLFLSILGAIVVYGAASTIFVLIATSGLFNDQMLDRYTDSGVTSSKTNIVIMIVYFLSTFFFKTKNKELKFMIQSCSLFGFIILMLSNLFEVAFRVSFYFMMPLLIFVPALIKEEKNDIKKFVGEFGLVLLFLMHYFINATHGLADTIPYKSVIFDAIF